MFNLPCELTTGLMDKILHKPLRIRTFIADIIPIPKARSNQKEYLKKYGGDEEGGD